MLMPTILVVEDELLIADLISIILFGAGHNVVMAGNGQEALVYIESERPDLILSDIMMPVMDGRELCKKLQSHPEHGSIPVVLMSAAYNPVNLDGCKRVAFLKKPFAVEELLTVVSDNIGQGTTTP
jgi:CheY-like chemotaxis protein